VEGRGSQVAKDLLAVGLGGAVGTGLRALGLLFLPPSPGVIPWVILLENLVGAFLLGGLAARVPGRFLRLRLFLLTGVLGSFTTFSALALDLVLLAEVAPGAATLYLGLSLGGGVGAAAVGMRVGRA